MAYPLVHMAKVSLYSNLVNKNMVNYKLIMKSILKYSTRPFFSPVKSNFSIRQDYFIGLSVYIVVS